MRHIDAEVIRAAIDSYLVSSIAVNRSGHTDVRFSAHSSEHKARTHHPKAGTSFALEPRQRARGRRRP
jgi:hypothetical protein